MATPKVKVSSYLKVPFRVVPKESGKKLQGKALVRVEAPAAAESRTPIDLVVVLDVSSGGGDGLAGDNTAVAPTTTTTTEKPSSMLDLVDKALTFIKTHLEDGLDRFSMVSSNKHGDSRCTAHGIKVSGRGGLTPAERVHQVDIVGHMGSRSDLEHAMKVLDERPDKTRQGFVILLSDGLAGKSKPSSSDPKGRHDVLTTSKYIYPVHTFGLGKAHDPKILRSIAKETNGTYSSITEDLDCKTMEALAVCLAGLKSVVAVDTCVEIKPLVVEPAAAAEIITATGLKEEIKDFRAAKNPNVINLGVLYAGEVKEFIVDIEINSCKVTSAGFHTVDLSTVTVSYKDAQGRQGEQAIKPLTHTREAAVWAAKKVKTHNKLTEFTPSPMVLQQLVQFKVLEFMHEFQKQLDAMNENPVTEKDDCIIGQGEGERHHPILQKMAAKKLEEMWDEFKGTRELAEEARSIGLDLVGRFDDDIGAMVSCLKGGSGLGCIYSWVFSHEMQQACFTGLPTPPAFLTPAMKKMVKEAQEQSAKDDARTPPPGGEGYMYMRELLEKMCNSLEGIGSKLEQSNAHFRNAVAIVMPLATNPPPAGNVERPS